MCAVVCGGHVFVHGALLELEFVIVTIELDEASADMTKAQRQKCPDFILFFLSKILH